jgi:hypothetical protein
MAYLPTEFHTLSLDTSLVIVIWPKSKENFRKADMLFAGYKNYIRKFENSFNISSHSISGS